MKSLIGLALGALCVSAVSVAGEPPADLALNSLNASFNTPLAARHAGDGSGRLFVVERDGTIVIYHPDTGLLPTPFLDVIDDVDTFFEGGLLGLAFHPNYSSNGFFYVNYTRSGTDGDALETIIERFSVSAESPDVADKSGRLEIIGIGQPAGNHNGGDIHFGPDGYLYIGLGDGGASSSTSQNPDLLLGKMLRIAPCDTESCSSPYTIPPTNPSRGVEQRDEIWATGFRNPYRWSFDRETGDMFIADVGAGSREEVSFEPSDSAGDLNYGWNCREGDIVGPGGCSGEFVDPILTYPHTQANCSITGGYRYKGCIQSLRGTYIYADFCTAKIFFGNEVSPGLWNSSEWDDLGGSVFGFGEDEDGEVYVLTGSSVRRFESDSSCSETPLFKDGFE